MPISYTNRCGDTYYLQCGTTKTGKPSYSFGRKITKTPVDEIPEGYEIYELPDNGQVFLRKVKPTAILPDEREKVAEEIRTKARVDHFLVEVDGDTMIVHTANIQPAEADEVMDELFGGMSIDRSVRKQLEERFGRSITTRSAAQATMIDRSRYIKMMRFKLVDEDKRLFSAERWCFRGSIDGWWMLQIGVPLPKLLDKYIQHLGKESFFELM